MSVLCLDISLIVVNSPRESVGVCFYRRWFVCVCMSVCDNITKTIVDGFGPNFVGRFLGEREDQVRVSLQSVEECGSNGPKTPSTGDCSRFFSSNSRCGTCCQVLATKKTQISL